jgi:hypothetical protein
MLERRQFALHVPQAACGFAVLRPITRLRFRNIVLLPQVWHFPVLSATLFGL